MIVGAAMLMGDAEQGFRGLTGTLVTRKGSKPRMHGKRNTSHAATDIFIQWSFSFVCRTRARRTPGAEAPGASTGDLSVKLPEAPAAEVLEPAWVGLTWSFCLNCLCVMLAP